MFTTVNSNKKIDKFTLEQDSCSSSELESSNLNKKRFFISKKLKKFFSFSDDYFSLQLAIFCLTFILSVFASLVSCLIISLSFGFSLFIGSIAGILYLRLLAKNIGNLGKTSLGVSKVQLLMPICLFIFASKSELIEILPSIIGFFLFKPAMFYYFSRS